MGFRKYIALTALTASLLTAATGCGFGNGSNPFQAQDSDSSFEYEEEERDESEQDEKSIDKKEEATKGETRTEATVPPATEARTATSDNSSWRNEYQKVLNNVNSSEAAFDLIFIDDDDIPELLVSEGVAHVAGCEIYTMYNGKCVSLGNYGIYGEVGYVDNSKRIMVSNLQQGYTSFFVGEIKNGGVISIFTASDNTGASGSVEDYIFTVNDNQVSETEYNDSVNKYFGHPRLDWAGRRYPIQTDVVKAALNADPPASYKYNEPATEPPTQAPTDPPAASAVTGRVITQDDDLNVRSGPSVNHDKIGTVAKGSTVVVLGEQNGWYLIEFAGGTGYVSAQYIAVGSTATVTANTSSGSALNYVHIGIFISKYDAKVYADELASIGYTDVCVKKTGDNFIVQVGAFAEYNNAVALAETLKAAGHAAYVTNEEGIIV